MAKKRRDKVKKGKKKLGKIKVRWIISKDKTETRLTVGKTPVIGYNRHPLKSAKEKGDFKAKRHIHVGKFKIPLYPKYFWDEIKDRKKRRKNKRDRTGRE